LLDPIREHEMHKSLTLGGSILRYGLVAAIGVISAFGVIVRYEYKGTKR
jgi:hypothetical protein